MRTLDFLRSSAAIVVKCISPSLGLALFFFLASACLSPPLAFAQQKTDLGGDYTGFLGPLHVKLHLVAAHDGALSGTVDSPDQNMMGLPCADFHLNGQALSFTVPMVRGTWTGLVSGDGSSLSGVWSQGSPMPLNLTRVTAAPASSAAVESPPLPPNPHAVVKWDDYTFKYSITGTSAQVFEGDKVVGTILTMNGDQRMIPIPGTDSTKLMKSFDDYKAFAARSHSGSSTVATAAAPPAPAAGAAFTDIKWDVYTFRFLSGNQMGQVLDANGHLIATILDSGGTLKLFPSIRGSDANKLAKSFQAWKDQGGEAALGYKPATPQPASSPAQPAPATSTETASNNSGAPKSGKGLGSIFQSTSDILHGRSVIDRIGLRNVLPQWDPQEPLSEQFPHVAITVLYAPAGWMDPYITDASAQGRSIISHCFQLEAVVWSDAQQSKRVKFEWCSNKDEFLDRLGPDYVMSLMPRYREPGYGTGIQRTEGPAPPSKMIPDDRATLDMEAKTNPHGASIDLNRDYTTRFALMFANIRKDLGQTLTGDGDPRVWIVTIKKASGPSIF